MRIYRRHGFPKLLLRRSLGNLEAISVLRLPGTLPDGEGLIIDPSERFIAPSCGEAYQFLPKGHNTPLHQRMRVIAVCPQAKTDAANRPDPFSATNRVLTESSVLPPANIFCPNRP